MKGSTKKAAVGLGAIAAAAAAVLVGKYRTRFQTMSTIEKLTNYADGFNLYRMDVKYDYSLDRIIDYGLADDQRMVDALAAEALPGLPVHINALDFSCSAFSITAADGDALMGRNYDFRNDTSCMLVHTTPKDGYESVGFAALDNAGVKAPEASCKEKVASLLAPFLIVDGVNEKGVSIAVLTLDTEPTVQSSGKPAISTSVALRMVLDRAATTQEAVDLLRKYDMHAAACRDYHFYVNDASGDGRAIEYDCQSEGRELVDTPVRCVTNYFALYADKVLPNQRNGIYGHGKERRDRIEDVLMRNEGNFSEQVAWEALQSAQQLPNPDDVTSNTQWSVVFNNTQRTAAIALRRHYEDIMPYALAGNTVMR